jgi:hypothetical protein
MRTIRKLAAGGLVSAAAAGVILQGTPSWAAGGSDSAASTKRGCDTEVFYKITSKSVRSLWIAGTNFVDGPGGTISGSVHKSHTKSASVSASVSVSARYLIAEAKAEVSGSITKSNTVTVGHSYQHKISKKKYGHIRYRVVGYKVWFEKKKITATCGSTLLGTGTAILPTTKEGWKYWETKRP